MLDTSYNLIYLQLIDAFISIKLPLYTNHALETSLGLKFILFMKKCFTKN